MRITLILIAARILTRRCAAGDMRPSSAARKNEGHSDSAGLPITGAKRTNVRLEDGHHERLVVASSGGDQVW